MAQEGRRPTQGKKILDALERSGERGMTTIALSKLLYNDIGYPPQGKVTGKIQNLRKQGHKILMIRDDGYQSGRYVLAEKREPSGKETLGKLLEIQTSGLAELDQALPPEALAKILVEQLTSNSMKEKLVKVLLPFVRDWLDGRAA